MPSWEIFDHQTQEYRDSVLRPSVKARVAIEQASTFGWAQYVGDAGRVIGMETFGASAPLKELQRKFGFEPDRVAAVPKELLGRRKACGCHPQAGCYRKNANHCEPSRPEESVVPASERLFPVESIDVFSRHA
jgi:hypothetical protein